nr:hypothetical protein HmN_000664200 [Hymenolepis microstoma]
MSRQREKRRIESFVNHPTGRQFLQIVRSNASSLYLRVLCDPEGYIRLHLPTDSSRLARWDVEVPNNLPDRYGARFHFRVKNMTQGFMACMFVVAERHGLEMPHGLILFDPEFYWQLPSLKASHSAYQLLEKSRILEFLNKPSGRQLFQIRANFENYLLLGTLPSPGGYVELIIPTDPQIQACWDLAVNGNRPRSHQTNYPYEVANMTQGFMACVFFLSRKRTPSTSRDFKKSVAIPLLQLTLGFTEERNIKVTKSRREGERKSGSEM